MYYVHSVDPHAGAEFADLYFDGHRYGVTETEQAPVSQVQFIFFLETRREVNDLLKRNLGKLTDKTNQAPPSEKREKDKPNV